MNIFLLDELRKKAEEALNGTDAFLRVSRSDGLFVTDAKRRNADMDELKEKLSDFSIIEKEGLLYLTPDYGLSDETSAIYTEILKSSGEKKEKLIRQSLSAAMRSKNAEQTELFGILYERMMNP